MKHEHKVIEVLISIIAFFFIWIPERPFWIENAKELKINKALYEEKAKYFSKKFANPTETWKGLDEDDIFPTINTRTIS